MTALWVAELETSHFSFRAYAESETDVLNVMKTAWEKHVEQSLRSRGSYGGRLYSWSDLLNGGDVVVRPVRIGAALRDGFEIVGPYRLIRAKRKTKR